MHWRCFISSCHDARGEETHRTLRTKYDQTYPHMAKHSWNQPLVTSYKTKWTQLWKIKLRKLKLGQTQDRFGQVVEQRFKKWNSGASRGFFRRILQQARETESSRWVLVGPETDRVKGFLQREDSKERFQTGKGETDLKYGLGLAWNNLGRDNS